MIDNFLIWIQTYAVALGLIGAFAAGLFPLVQYIWAKRDENRNIEFNNYHKLIGDLVDPPTPRLDRQIAAVYELRYFKKYFPVSIRILESVRTPWSSNPGWGKIINEIDLAIAFMKKHVKE